MALQIKCSECDGSMVAGDLGISTCPHCGHTVGVSLEPKEVPHKGKEILYDILNLTDTRRKQDAKRWEERDTDLCMLCSAYGEDKRSLFIHCSYDISEVIPEAIDLFDCGGMKQYGWYLRICKSCRGRLLTLLAQWRSECIARRSAIKDHDGYRVESYEL